MHADAHPAPVIGYVIGGVVFIGVLAFRMRRMMQPSPFDPYRAWLLPVLFLALSGLALFGAKPVGSDWLWVLGAFVIGGAIGYVRGASVRITVDPTTRRLVAKGSAMAMVFIVVLLAVRFGLRYLLSTDATALNLRPIMADVLSAVMGAGIFVTRGAEMGLRGHRLLQAQSPQIAAS